VPGTSSCIQDIVSNLLVTSISFAGGTWHFGFASASLFLPDKNVSRETFLYVYSLKGEKDMVLFPTIVNSVVFMIGSLIELFFRE